MLRGKISVLVIFALWATACSQGPQLKNNTITMDKPLIQNLDEVSPDLKKLQKSLVRLTVSFDKKSAYGTGFFFRSKDLLVTSQHLFPDNHECLLQTKCQIIMGIAKNARELKEHIIGVEVVMQDRVKDLIYLKVAVASLLSDIVPIKEKALNSKGALTAAGFFQDQPALTFSQGQSLEDKNQQTQTNIIVSAGFSGSPVVNKKGELVGIVSSFRPIQGQSIGLAQFINNPF